MIKIISGGQTGVDQGALKAGLDCGAETGGYCPPGRVCDGGEIPPDYPLTETPEDRSLRAPDIPRSMRTELNVLESDGTAILIPSDLEMDQGTRWTVVCCEEYKKPFIVLDPFSDREDIVEGILAWLNRHNIRVLNVAGPGERNAAGIFDATYAIIREVLQRSGEF